MPKRIIYTRSCPKCSGTGEMPCPECNGSGYDPYDGGQCSKCAGLHQGIFATQGSNPGLLHCRQILYPLSPKGGPREAQEQG